MGVGWFYFIYIYGYLFYVIKMGYGIFDEKYGFFVE